MLKTVDELPWYSGKEPSPVRAFAREALAEFAESAGQIAEVEGAPGEPEQLAVALRNEVAKAGMRGEVAVCRRGRRVFLRRRGAAR